MKDSARLILNVEADTTARTGRSRILRDAGFRVEEISTGADAVRATAERQPDLVLIGNALPDMPPDELCRRLKSGARQLPVIRMSQSPVADAFLSEPVHPQALAATIRALVHGDPEDSYRKPAESAELERRELESIISSMNDGLMLFDTQGRLLLMNPAARKMQGFGPGARIPEKLEDYDRVMEYRDGNGKLIPLAEWPAMRSLAGEIVTGTEMHGRRRDTGHTSVTQRNSAPVRNAAGEIERVVVTLHDISDLKRIEQALRDSEEQWRTLADSISHLAWMADGTGWIFWYNQRWYEYTGTTFDDMKGWGWKAVHHPDHLERVTAKWRRALAAGEFWEDTFPLRSKDGTYRWFLSRAVPIRDAQGRVVRWLGTNTDITDRLETEEKMRRSEQGFRQLADSIPHALWVMRPDGSLQYLNRRFFEYTGITPEEAYREGWRSANLVHPEDIATLDAAMSEMFSAGHEIAGLEFRMKGGDGTYRWKTLRANVIRDGDGRVTHYIGTVTDIHDRKIAEEAVRQAQKLESIGLLAGGIAHDFNNLLVGIVGNASLAQDMLPREHRVRELLDRIIQAGDSAAYLTRQMLAYSGKGQFVIEPVNLTELVRNTMPLVQGSIPRRAELRLELEPALPALDADRSQMQQVFTNLIINAAEAIGNHGGRITVRTGIRRISAAEAESGFPGTQLTPGDYVYLQVRDTGSGMDEETKAKIFDPFFSTKFTGRGLGLAAVSGIVRGHKGAILVESAPGKGSTFTAFFPAGAAAHTNEDAVEARVDLRGREAVLVVDDEPAVREVAQAALQRYGYDVLLAANGEEAIEALARNKDRISIIVLDLSMPHMDGEQALPKLQEIKPGATVLIMSGYTESEALRLFAGKGVSGFIQKPFTIQRFAEKVKTALQKAA